MYRTEKNQIDNCMQKEIFNILLTRAQAGDYDAANIILEAYTPVITDYVKRRITDEPYNILSTYEDLCQDAFVGFYGAIQDYKLSMKKKFWHFAFTYVRDAIEKTMYEGGLVRIPASTMKEFRRVNKAVNKYQTGTDIDEEYLSCVTNKTKDRLNLLQNYESLLFNNNIGSFEEMLNDNTNQFEDYYFLSTNLTEETAMQNELSALLANMISQLPELEQRILILHLGLNGEEPMKFKQLSKLYNLSHEQVHAHLRRAYCSLKKSLCFYHCKESYLTTKRNRFDIDLDLEPLVRS